MTVKRHFILLAAIMLLVEPVWSAIDDACDANIDCGATEKCDTVTKKCVARTTCDSKTDCNDHPCKDDDHSCVCKDGYTGSDCSKVDCSTGTNACKNGGTCDTTGTKTCSCPAGYTGGYCEHVDCSTGTNACKNGGTCDTTGTKTCSCPAGYTGGYCEHAAQTSTPSQDGARVTEASGLIISILLSILGMFYM